MSKINNENGKGLNEMNENRIVDEDKEFELDYNFRFCKRIGFNFKADTLTKKEFLDSLFNACRRVADNGAISEMIMDANSILLTWEEFVNDCKNAEISFEEVENDDILDEDDLTDAAFVLKTDDYLAFNTVGGTIFPMNLEDAIKINDSYSIRLVEENNIEVLENASNEAIVRLSLDDNDEKLVLSDNKTNLKINHDYNMIDFYCEPDDEMKQQMEGAQFDFERTPYGSMEIIDDEFKLGIIENMSDIFNPADTDLIQTLSVAGFMLLAENE